MPPPANLDGVGGGSSYYPNQNLLGAGAAPGYLEPDNPPPVEKNTYIPPQKSAPQGSSIGSFFKSFFSAIGYILSGPTACTPKTTKVFIASTEMVRPSVTTQGPRIDTGGSYSQVSSLTSPEERFETRGVPAHHAYDFTNQLLEGAEVKSICVDRYRIPDPSEKVWPFPLPPGYTTVVKTLARNCLPNDTTQIPASLLKVPGKYVLSVRNSIAASDDNSPPKYNNFKIWFEVVASP